MTPGKRICYNRGPYSRAISITMSQGPINDNKQHNRTQAAASEFFSAPKGDDSSEEFIHG